MLHYHGTPITPETAALRAIGGGHAFVSFADHRQLAIVIAAASSFAVDNGAFTLWKRGESSPDWSPYYRWVDSIRNVPTLDFAVIPDVIDGTEEENDALLAAWPLPPHVGAPVWHADESIDRLVRLAHDWPRVCLGSAGEYSEIGTARWWRRMHEAIGAIVDAERRPICKLHGLRMLDPKVFGRLPFTSADSTNIARNIGIDSAWRGPYTPPTKESRAALMRERIESHQAPDKLDIDACAQEEFQLELRGPTA